MSTVEVTMRVLQPGGYAGLPDQNTACHTKTQFVDASGEDDGDLVV